MAFQDLGLSLIVFLASYVTTLISFHFPSLFTPLPPFLTRWRGRGGEGEREEGRGWRGKGWEGVAGRKRGGDVRRIGMGRAEEGLKGRGKW
jgi:hypothetical protein